MQIAGDVFKLVGKIARLLTKKNYKLAVAESCTGGLLAGSITAISGASSFFDRGFVTYSNRAKEEMLAVKAETLGLYGAVSEETASEMALGVLNFSEAEVAIAITGVAGPTGGTPDKPVGTICFAWGLKPTLDAEKKLLKTMRKVFPGERENIRLAAVKFSLEELLRILELEK
jgi:nicotinamide-nucleotide amidase